jgi:hypothetical protein
MSAYGVPAQVVDATQALNRSAALGIKISDNVLSLADEVIE